MDFMTHIMLALACVSGIASSIKHESIGGLIGSAIGLGFSMVAAFDALVMLSTHT